MQARETASLRPNEEKGGEGEEGDQGGALWEEIKKMMVYVRVCILHLWCMLPVGRFVLAIQWDVRYKRVNSCVCVHV